MILVFEQNISYQQKTRPAMQEDNLLFPGLSPVGRHEISARFDGGALSSDGGVLVLRQIEKRLNFAGMIASCLHDKRDANRTIHDYTTMIRSYGTARLIGWCQEAGWDYRLRMKGNITLQHRGGELLTREIAGLIPEGIVNAELYGTGVFSAIGVLHEEGHREPWIIAMNAAPSQGSRLWDALEHRSNVLRLQNPGLWHHPKPDQKAG